MDLYKLKHQILYQYRYSKNFRSSKCCWIKYYIKKKSNDWNNESCEACRSEHLGIVKLMIKKDGYYWNSGTRKCGHLSIIKMARDYPKEFRIQIIPRNNKIIKIIYASLYDYLPDEMINEVLKYSIFENFNLYSWKSF